MTLRIGHGNGHNEQSLVRFIRETTWDSFGCAEADRLIGDLHRVKAARVVVTALRFDRSRDAPVLVNRSRTLLRTTSTVVSRALGRRGSDLNRVAPARVLTEARYEHPVARVVGCKGVAHINLHPVAGPKQLNGRNPMAPLTRQYRKAWKAARKAARQARADGFVVVLTSDAQMDNRSRRPWAPAKQAKRMGLRTWSTGIDWLMFDPRLTLVGAPKVRRLYDHPGFVAELTAKE